MSILAQYAGAVIRCAGCGYNLLIGAGVTNTPAGQIVAIHVEPCPRCAATSHDEGYDEGYLDGLDKGGRGHEG